MKIFAKRNNKRKLLAEGPAAEKTFQSDAVVEDLLKLDPSTWNAKQRRLVKRYQDRKPPPDAAAAADAAVGGVVEQQQQQQQAPLLEEERNEDVVKAKDDADEAGDDSNDDDADSSGSDDDEEKDDDHSDVKARTEDELEELVEPVATDTMNGEGDKAETKPQETDPSNTNNNPSTIAIDDELKEMLDKLNSKQRRTLVRLLERDGNVEVVRAEAVKLLQAEKKLGDDDKQQQLEQDEPSKKKRRKGGDVDLSKLSPEERMRREEQKRLQQEAAKAREAAQEAVGTIGGIASKSKPHKHPLNSERRRANRRKPKWEPKSSSSAHAAPPNEHDSSGYHMRKITGGKPNQK